MGDEAGADRRLAQRKEQLEVCRRRTAAVGDLQLVDAALSHLDAVSWRVGGGEAIRVTHLDAEREGVVVGPVRLLTHDLLSRNGLTGIGHSGIAQP